MESKKKCVFGCDSLGAYMHRFPHPQKYSEMFILWLSSVGDNMQEKDHMKIYNTKRVCDYRFEFEVKVSGHRLLKSAVPTMYLQGVKKSNTIKVQLEHNYCLPRTLNTNTVPVPSTSQLLHESDPYRRERQKCLSRNSISDWFSYSRETVVIYHLEKQNEYTGKIGGPGKIVQIDESKFGKRKYNKGRHIEGHWVLGLIEDGSEDLRLEVCSDNVRSAEVLVPLIQKHVAVGTTIHTDCWRAYDCLSEHGYYHKKVNHSDPDNPFVAKDGTHTQRIEAQWRELKRFFRTQNYNNSENFGDLLVEYAWRRNIVKFKKDPFQELINAIKHIYKV